MGLGGIGDELQKKREKLQKKGISVPANPRPPERNSLREMSRDERSGGRGGGNRGGDRREYFPGYLKEGYFQVIDTVSGPRNCLRTELLTTVADDIADRIGNARVQLTTHQLRRFFNHAKVQQRRLEYLGDFRLVQPDVMNLAAFVKDAAGKNPPKVPDEFVEFIQKNLSCIIDRESFVKGFMEHFQAVVCSFAYLFPKRR